MQKGVFHKPTHRSFVTLLYYTGVRRWEALRATPEQFQITEETVYFDVLKRLKHGKTTPPLPIPRSAKYVELIVRDVRDTKPKKRIWRFCPATAYNVVRRVWDNYPHHLRLSRITNFFTPDEQGKSRSIAQVQTWTGLTLGALNFYVGLVELRGMGETLRDG